MADLELQPCQTVVVAGRTPADPPEFYEVASIDGATIWCKTWCPLLGTFTDQLTAVPRVDILRRATGGDRLPVTTQEATCA